MQEDKESTMQEITENVVIWVNAMNEWIQGDRMWRLALHLYFCRSKQKTARKEEFKRDFDERAVRED